MWGQQANADLGNINQAGTSQPCIPVSRAGGERKVKTIKNFLPHLLENLDLNVPGSIPEHMRYHSVRGKGVHINGTWVGCDLSIHPGEFGRKRTLQKFDGGA